MAGNRDPYKPNTGCTDERIAKDSPVKKSRVVRTASCTQDTAHNQTGTDETYVKMSILIILLIIKMGTSIIMLIKGRLFIH